MFGIRDCRGDDGWGYYVREAVFLAAFISEESEVHHYWSGEEQVGVDVQLHILYNSV